MEDYRVTLGSIYNLDLLVEHWLLMWKDEQAEHAERIERIEASRELSRKWMIKKMLNNELIPFVANSSAGSIVGSGCILIREDRLRLSTAQLLYPYLLSMYTVPEHRNKGIGTMIVEAMIKWSIDQGYDRMELHTSEQARKIFTKLGFKNTSEMFLKLFNG